MPKKRTIAQTPAPKKDRIYGSKINPKGSASSESKAKDIVLDAKTIIALTKKLTEFKKSNPDNKKITLSDLKAVFRRGAGAYSKSHRPTISGGKPNSRNAWALARVNKFLEKASGKQVKKAYVQDDDLLKYSEGGQVKSFYQWYIDWYKGIKNDITIMISLPNELRPFAEENVVILDKFKKDNASVKAYKYMQKIVDKADEFKVTIYLEPKPIGDTKTKWELIDYYRKFGFELTENKEFMKRLPKYAEGGLVAPNGRPSNLTPEQYKLVRIPEFKAWFGDWENDPANASKVVDENGEPLVVYHGTNSDFNTFKFDKTTIGTFGKGFYFTNDRDFALNYAKGVNGKILSCFLKINKIFKINNFEMPIGYEKYLNMYENKGLSRDFTNKLINQNFNGVFSKNPYNENEYVVFAHPFRNVPWFEPCHCEKLHYIFCISLQLFPEAVSFQFHCWRASGIPAFSRRSEEVLPSDPVSHDPSRQDRPS